MNARNRFLNVAAAALFLMSASGCVCVVGGGGSGGAAGNIDVLWSFGGNHKCYEVPQVTKVHVTVPGQTLQNDGVFPCTANNVDGVTLLNFKGGTYTVKVEGITDTNVVLYSGSATVKVNGNVSTAIDLTAASGAPAYAYLTWKFPANGSFATPNCAQAGVTKMVIAVDGQQGVAYTCADGFGTTGVLVTTTEGNHSVTLSASDDNGFYYYQKTSTLPPVIAGGAVSAEYTMDWAVGSLPLRWTFLNGGITRTCSAVGATQVRIDLLDANNQYVYGSNGTTVNCATGSLQGTTFPYLYPGTYKVSVQAAGTGGYIYKSNQTTWPTATVTAGQFPQVSTSTPEVVLQ